MRFIRGFGAFWYDFLIGDRPELFIGGVAALVLVWVAMHLGLQRVAAALALTVLVLVVGGASLWLAVRPKRSTGSH
jgi:hypothetical protein